MEQRRAFVAVMLGTLLVIVLLGIARTLTVDEIAARAADCRPLGMLERIVRPHGTVTREWAALRFDAYVVAAVVFAVAGWALFALVCVLRARRAGLALWLPALILFWFAFDFLAGRWLVIPLDLWQYAVMRDIDHRPNWTTGEYNSDSLRGTAEPGVFVPGGRNIVFLGDSFAFGAGVAPEEAFPSLVERDWNAEHADRSIRVANFGWVSSSPILSLRRLRDTGEKYNPRMVVMCVDMTDFRDDLRYTDMFERRGVYALYERVPITLRIFQSLAPRASARFVTWSLPDLPPQRFFASLHPLEETRPLIDVLWSNVRAIDGWCKERGVEFALVVLPRHFQYSDHESPHSPENSEYVPLGPYALEPFRYFDAVKGSVGFPVFSLLDDFRNSGVYPTCFDDDPHWNPAGHAIAARALLRCLGPIIGRL